MNVQGKPFPQRQRPWPAEVLRAAVVALAALVCSALLALPAAAITKPVDLAGFVRTDPRAQAMGNAFGAVARGDTALYYNPAGLVQSSFDVHLEASLVGLGDDAFLSDVYDMFTGNPAPADVAAFLSANLGTTRYFQHQVNYSAVAGLAAFKMGVGFGVKRQTRIRFLFDDPGANGFDPLAPPNDDVLYEFEEVLEQNTISAAFPLLEGQMLLGISLKRFTFDDKQANDTFDNIFSGNSIQFTTVGDSYTGQAYDVGMIWRMETFAALRGQFSVVANNVGGVSLAGPTDTLEIPASYDVGFAINPELPGSPVHFLFSAEYEDVTGAVQVFDPNLLLSFERETKQKLHLGAELGFWETGAGNNVLSVRFGNNRGQATYGAELNFSFFRLVYTLYKDDVGYSGASDVHTFRVMQASLGIGF